MSKAKTGGVNYEYYINNYSSWYGGDRNEYEDCKKEIQLSLNSKNPDWAEVSTNMEYIAEYYACKGNLLAFTNKLSGWLLLIQGFYYADWATKISYRYYDFLDSTYDEEEDEFLFKSDISKLNSFLGFGFIACPSETEYFFHDIDTSISCNALCWKYDDCLCEYLYHLYLKLKNREVFSILPKNKIKWDHPYSNIFNHWDNISLLKTDINNMLDYHLKWNLGYASSHSSEFHSHFSMINPIELHALEYVRRKLGLETPIIKHCLVSEPFYPLPEQIRTIDLQYILKVDPLLRDIYYSSKKWCNCDMK